MGMDVYGKKPTSEKGSYFRANVWWWRPIWDYCLMVHPDIACKVQYGHTNDGDGLKARDAKNLGRLILKDIKTGFAQAYIQERQDFLDALPLNDCEYCDENGERTWSQENGMSITKTCNACEGTKKVKKWETNYPMTVEFLQEFAEFMIDSGGFEIW